MGRPKILVPRFVEEKRCSKCKITKPRADFYPRKSNTGTALCSWCKVCSAGRSAEAAKRNRERCREATARWLVKNREIVNEKRRNKRLEPDVAYSERLKYKYGLTLAEYNQRLQDQGNRCAICRTDKPGNNSKLKRFSVDHCHSTGVIRGLLCHNCNVGVGNFKDSPMLLMVAMNYVIKHQPPIKKVG